MKRSPAAAVLASIAAVSSIESSSPAGSDVSSAAGLLAGPPTGGSPSPYEIVDSPRYSWQSVKIVVFSVSRPSGYI